MATPPRRRKRPSRVWRFLPARIRRMRARWRRRVRKAHAVHQAVKPPPGRVRHRARKVAQAYTTTTTTVAGAYRTARSMVRPDGPRRVHCPCGTQVPASEFAAHTTRHEQRDTRARRETETKRAAAAKRRGQRGARSELTQRAIRARADSRAATGPTAVSRRDAAASSAGWLAVGGVLIALPLDGVGSAWMYAAGAGCALIGGGAYATERRWGNTNHVDRESRRALRRQAQAAGCNATCMTSSLPVRTCRCPCSGASHGTARKG